MDLKRKKFTEYQNLANEISLEFQKRGFLCFWVGGAVRDLLLGKKVEDIDLATNATPKEVKKILTEKRIRLYDVGEKFGTIGAITKRGNIEITTFRMESVYSDNRHPDSVKYAQTPKVDSGRRDFTINALYFDPKTKEILDFHDGQKDLNHKTLRFIGSPEKRIKEDPLRLLRAVRFAANLNIKIAKKDLESIQKKSGEIKKVSSERIKKELDKIFSNQNYIQGALLLEKTKLLKALFPEVDNLRTVMQSADYHAEGNALNHTFNALRNCKKYSLTLRYAVFFHDIGKKFTAKMGERKGREHISFHGHALKSAELFAGIAKRVRFTKKEKIEIQWLLKHHMDLVRLEEVNEKTLVKWAKNDAFGDLILLRMADSLGGTMTDSLGRVIAKDISGLKKLYRNWKKLNELSRVNLVTGDDVMKILKIKPGKYVGVVLEKIKREQIFGRVKNKKEALAYLYDLTTKNT
jgi:tRNA nucleotidyltransferase/poly(A) polymerase